MLRNIVNDSSDGEPDTEANDTRPTQSLSCDDPSCKATTFPNLSKLNKHRNSHSRPYKCSMNNCSKNFAQRQHLERHLEIKHQDTTPQTTYYHCTVDGCKYASTGRRRKRFSRPDQLKEHIKDYGHYGPHSANDRMRRPGKNLWDEYQISVWFEKWILEENDNQNLTPRRILQSCEYNSYKTKLWHKDDIGEQFLRGQTLVPGHACLVPDCYYQSKPIEGLEVIVFKTLKELQDHRRDAHESPKQIASLSSQLQLHSSEEQRSIVGFDSADVTQPWYGISFEPAIDLGTSSRGDLNESSWWTSFDFSVPTMEDWMPLSSPTTSYSITDFSSQSLPLTVSTQESWPVRISSDSKPKRSLEASSMPTVSDGRTGSDKNQSTYPSIARMKCQVISCNKTFRRKGDMQRHVESVHRLSMPFVCPLCPRQFHRKDKANAHCKAVHKSFINTDSMKAKSLLAETSDSSLPECRNVIPGHTLTNPVSIAPDTSNNEKCSSDLPSLEPQEAMELDPKTAPS